ncbi:hypothetical protein CZ771_02405 [Actinomycetales bacterium JB111]|nr:hypothetical protein CZ771_02405 [Actinomycetales bacterium JB111]
MSSMCADARTSAALRAHVASQRMAARRHRKPTHARTSTLAHHAHLRDGWAYLAHVSTAGARVSVPGARAAVPAARVAVPRRTACRPDDDGRGGTRRSRPARGGDGESMRDGGAGVGEWPRRPRRRSGRPRPAATAPTGRDGSARPRRRRSAPVPYPLTEPAVSPPTM